MFKRLTPVLIVDAIEPVLPFWDALGFTRGPSVPHGDRLGFVILEADGIEVMYQTVDSVQDDEPRVLGKHGASMLYIEVDDLDAVAARVPKDTEVIVHRRVTTYGATEMIVRDPAGNVIAFSKM